MPVQTQMQVRRGTASSWTSTNPTLAAGELGFETDTGKFKIGTGSSTWTALPYAGGGQNTLTTYQYTATAGQTTFSGADINSNTLSYTAGAVQVYLNGALLQNTVDYAASTGTSVVLTGGAGLGDSLTILSLGSFTVSTDIPKSTLTAKGSIIAASGAATPANLSVGANGTVLTADSAEATGLKWATPASGGMELISTTTISNQSTVSLSSIPGTYNYLQIIIQDFLPSNNDSTLRMRMNGDSGAKYRSLDYNPASFNSQETFAQTSILVSSFQSSTSSNSLMRIDIPDYANTVSFKMSDCFSMTMYPATPTLTWYAGGGFFNSTSAVTSLDFFASSGNIVSGTIKLYGVK